MGHLFISYGSEDRDRARQFAESLENCGWDVWWDREIPAGQNYDQVIAEALESAQGVVVLWSETSVGKDWVREEAGVGKARGRLFPVRIDPEVALPIGFTLIQAPDLSRWGGDPGDPEFQEFASHVAEGLGSDPRPRDWRARTFRTFIRRRRRQAVLALALLAPAVLAGAMALWPTGMATISLEVDATELDFSLTESGGIFTDVADLQVLTAGPLVAVRASPSVGPSVELDGDGRPMGLVVFAEPGAELEVAQVGVPAGTGFTLSTSRDGMVVDLSGPDLPALDIWTRGPVALDLFTEDIDGVSLPLTADPEGLGLRLYASPDTAPRLTFSLGDAPSALLMEEAPIQGLRFAQVTRVRAGEDITRVESSIRGGHLTFFPGLGGDSVPLVAGDILTFDEIRGSLTRVEASDTLFRVTFTGPVAGPRLSNGGSPERALPMPSLLETVWVTRRPLLLVLLGTYAVLVFGFTARRRRV